MRSGPFFHLIFVFFLVGCGVPKASRVGGGESIAILPGPAEESYCSTTMTYSSPITISGSATYQARVASSSGLGAAGAAKPIRYAEVMVKNSAGSIAQCAETDGNGDYSFQLPNDGGSYTVYVNSRAYNDHAKVSVLDAPNSKRYYSLAGTFVANGTKNLSTMNAEVTEAGLILGGAFNIFDQIVEANEYLISQVSNCSATYTGCANVATSVPKVEAYWKKGVDPGAYINSSDPLSFYLPGYARLFILGGLNGNTDSTDTDHFDNSVIIHEYGHFLEDTLFASNSPGGRHNGNSIIDPRLAWSEGFANFFQAAVLNNPWYLDTYGNVDGAQTGAYFNRSIENATTGSDIPTASGEGNFREFSVARLLWDAIDSNSDSVNGFTDSVSGAFADIWAAVTKSSGGLNQANLAFRNIGDFHVFQDALTGGTDFSDIRGVEHQVANTAEYAQYVTTGTTCDYSLTPDDQIGDAGSFSTSDLFRNNDFYHLNISSQTATITLEYEDANGSGTEADVDLYVYNSSARYGVTADMVGYSEAEPDRNELTAETESVTASFPAGDYLINVKVYTGGAVGDQFDYKIKLNGSELCPSSLP